MLEKWRKASSHTKSVYASFLNRREWSVGQVPNAASNTPLFLELPSDTTLAKRSLVLVKVSYEASNFQLGFS